MLAGTLQPDLVLIPGLEVFAVIVVGLQALIVSDLEALTVQSVCANIVCIVVDWRGFWRSGPAISQRLVEVLQFLSGSV